MLKHSTLLEKVLKKVERKCVFVLTVLDPFTNKYKHFLLCWILISIVTDSLHAGFRATLRLDR